MRSVLGTGGGRGLCLGTQAVCGLPRFSWALAAAAEALDSAAGVEGTLELLAGSSVGLSIVGGRG